MNETYRELYEKLMGKYADEKLCRILAARYHWDLNHSYRVPGWIVPKQKIVVFDLNRAEIANREDSWVHFRNSG